jgi:hypothetical protein
MMTAHNTCVQGVPVEYMGIGFAGGWVGTMSMVLVVHLSPGLICECCYFGSSTAQPLTVLTPPVAAAAAGCL